MKSSRPETSNANNSNNDDFFHTFRPSFNQQRWPHQEDPELFFRTVPRGFGSGRPRFPHFDDYNSFDEDFGAPNFVRPFDDFDVIRRQPQQQQQARGQAQQPRQQRAYDDVQPRNVPIRVVRESDGPQRGFTQQQAQPVQRGQQEEGGQEPQGGGNAFLQTPQGRGERAHSEPPKHFQDLPFNQNTRHPATIDEEQLRNQSNNTNNLAQSASDPSVPDKQESNKAQNDQQQGVRHIPIFVEGQKEPIQPQLRKPSDFYQQPKRGDQQQQEQQGQEQPVRGAERRRHLPLHTRPSAPTTSGGQNEPTSPISPPPGPIPMGFVPMDNKGLNEDKKDVNDLTSPLPAPEGPIPMGYRPDFMGPVDKSQKDQQEILKSASESNTKRDEGENTQGTPSSGEDAATLAKMEGVQKAVENLQKRIEQFKGDKKDKEYVYLDEMLTRHLLSLDSVDTGGKENLRSARKESIKRINRCLSLLDAKAKESNCPQERNTSLEQEVAETNNQILADLAELTQKQQIQQEVKNEHGAENSSKGASIDSNKEGGKIINSGKNTSTPNQ